MSLTTAAAVAGLVVLLVVQSIRARRHGREAGRLRDRLGTAARELQSLQQSFARFTPEEVVERIVASGVSTDAERREVTVLFADIVGFSALSERLDPEVLVRVLNGYFRRMSRAANEHRGHVAKFIGDGMLVLFGGLEPNPWQANDAVRAALAMRATLAGYNEELAAEGLGPLAFGIGIHQGPVVAGIVGSPELLEFTVIGKNVNVAERVERLTREQESVDILITGDLRERLDPRFLVRELPPARLRGLSDEVVTYAVEGFSG